MWDIYSILTFRNKETCKNDKNKSESKEMESLCEINLWCLMLLDTLNAVNILSCIAKICYKLYRTHFLKRDYF